MPYLTLNKTKMKKTFKIKTIDIQAKEWFDKANGNSYFSAIVTLNYGLKDCKVIGIPFQYGYENGYIHTALHVLQCENYIPCNDVYSLPRYCYENGIELRTSKKENCLKREVKEFTKYL